ncbi:MAG TPA: hypothetical protein VES42_14830 [Pilimelia sp.]|nr:hypothetical protein [Pilimelia sp.]
MAVLTAATILGVAGCGTDQPPVCDSLAAAQATMNHIRNANVAENGLAPLEAQLQQLNVDVSRLRADAATHLAPEFAAVKAAADQLSASLAAAREVPDAAHLSAVRTTLGAVQVSLRSLGDAMSDTC